MKTILCFGDSNTWGFVPGEDCKRYPPHDRWPGVLRNALGAGFDVIEEGLNGRTTVLDVPTAPYKNGKDYLVPCLESHAPLDLVILMLGTNDLKHRFGLSAPDIAENMAALIELIRHSGTGPGNASPRVLLLAPPPLAKLTILADMYEGAIEQSQQLGRHYRAVAAQAGCEFLDTSEIIRCSDIDGVHLDSKAHRTLGARIAVITQGMFP